MSAVVGVPDPLGRVFRPSSSRVPSAPVAGHVNGARAKVLTNGSGPQSVRKAASMQHVQPFGEARAPLSVDRRLHRLEQRHSVGKRSESTPAALARTPSGPGAAERPPHQPAAVVANGVAHGAKRSPPSAPAARRHRSLSRTRVQSGPSRPQGNKIAQAGRGERREEQRGRQPGRGEGKDHCERPLPYALFASGTHHPRGASLPAFRRGPSRDFPSTPPRLQRSGSTSAALACMGHRVRRMYEVDKEEKSCGGEEATSRRTGGSRHSYNQPHSHPPLSNRSQSLVSLARAAPMPSLSHFPAAHKAPRHRLREALSADVAFVLAANEEKNIDASLRHVGEVVESTIAQWGEFLAAHRAECATCRVALAHVDEIEGTDNPCSTRHVHAACAKAHRKLHHELQKAIRSRLSNLVSALQPLQRAMRPSEPEALRLEAFVHDHDSPSLANLNKVESMFNQLSSAKASRAEVFQAMDAHSRLLTAMSLFHHHLSANPAFSLRFRGTTRVTNARFEAHTGRKVVETTRALKTQLEAWERANGEMLIVSGRRYLAECLPSELELQAAEMEIGRLVQGTALYAQPIERDGLLTAPQPPVLTTHVVVRVRPRLPHEADQATVIRALEDGSTISVINGDQRKVASFSSCVPPHATQEDVFEICNMPAVVEALVARGVSTTVVAVGHTQSGKTHTLYGPDEVVGAQEEEDPLLTAVEEEVQEVVEDIRIEHVARQGLVQRTAVQLFASLAQAANGRHQIGVTFVEVLKETVRDLLQPGTPAIGVRSTAVGFEPGGATIAPCSSVGDLVTAIAQGHSRRTAPSPPTSASPSHTLLSVHLMAPGAGQHGRAVRTGAITFVDVGASVGGEGKGKGDRGLQALKRVVVNLTEGNAKPATHVPFRDSNLTRLLAHALSEGQVRVVVACVSPCVAVVDDSVRVLDFASRAANLGVDPSGVCAPDAPDAPEGRQAGAGSSAQASGIGALRTEQQAAQQELQRLRQLLASAS